MLDLVESKLSQHEAFRADVLAGLAQRQKSLPSRWLYDQRGSELFEEITSLDEYYLTRIETAIFGATPGRWPLSAANMPCCSNTAPAPGSSPKS